MVAVFLALLLLAGAILWPGAGDGGSAEPRQESAAGMDIHPLILLARPEGDTFARGDPIPVAVTLRNASAERVWVNARLGIGYEDGLFRELYVTVTDQTGAILPVPETARVDVHRMPPAREDFRELGPGDEVSTTVDLAFWYPVPQPGTYRVTVTYENQESGAAFGIAAFTGTVRAEPFEITIT